MSRELGRFAFYHELKPKWDAILVKEEQERDVLTPLRIEQVMLQQARLQQAWGSEPWHETCDRLHVCEGRISKIQASEASTMLRHETRALEARCQQMALDLLVAYLRDCPGGSSAYVIAYWSGAASEYVAELLSEAMTRGLVTFEASRLSNGDPGPTKFKAAR